MTESGLSESKIKAAIEMLCCSYTYVYYTCIIFIVECNQKASCAG